ncbi:MAG: hypothetical protein JXR36_00940, partial [Bacteroidales bacterium]|nr:hypothetical protein [Bacteroidales bacterium]
CDVCQNMKDLEVSTFEFKDVGKRIQQILEKPCKLEDLIFRLKGDNAKMRKVLKWYLDNQKITYRVDGLLEWKE